MFRYVLVFVVFIFVGFSGYLSYHLGVWKSVQVERKQLPAYFLLYKDHMGPYHKTVTKIVEVEKWAEENKIDCHLSFGKYLDDPEATDEARLRSYGGCFQWNDKQLSLDDFKKSLPALPADTKLEANSGGDHVVAEFLGSPGIGPMKVYPKVNEFMLEARVVQKGPVLEIYEILDREAKREMKTTYLFPL